MRGAISPIVDIDHEVVVPYCGLINMQPSLKTTCLHFISKLGPWRFHSSEAYRSEIISYVDWKGGK